MRLFIALTIDEKIKEEIYKYIEGLKVKTDAKIKWVEKENLHITLKFLGEVRENKLEDIKNALRQTVLGSSVFDLDFKGAGSFPPGKNPRVIWVGAESNKVVKLSKKIDDIMSSVGFKKEERNFKSHITIGRIKEGRFDIGLIEKDIDKFFGSMVVEKVDLYRSYLSPRGPKYEIIETFLAQ